MSATAPSEETMPQRAKQQKQIAVGIQRIHSARSAGLLNVEEFANAVGWSQATVRMKVWKREIEFVRLGRSIRFRPEMVERLIAENIVPAKS